MLSMKLTIVIAMVMFSTLLLEQVSGNCTVSCLLPMLKCARKADALRQKLESTDCCDQYFDCMTACGAEVASCGKRRMEKEKRGSWNKRYDFDEYSNLPFPIS